MLAYVMLSYQLDIFVLFKWERSVAQVRDICTPFSPVYPCVLAGIYICALFVGAGILMSCGFYMV